MVISIYSKYFLFEILLSLVLLAKAEEDVIYTAAFSEDAKTCDGFKNEILILDDLKTGTNNGEPCLKGKVYLKEDIPLGTEVSISVWKVDGIVEEFVYTAASDFCKSVKLEESPWYPLFKSFDQTECPISANTYDVNDMSLSMDYAQEYMNPNLCGEYKMEMSLMNGPDKLSCHIIQAAVQEDRQG